MFYLLKEEEEEEEFKLTLMEKTGQFEMPQVELHLASRTMIRTENPFLPETRLKEKLGLRNRKPIVEALTEIAIGEQYEEGESLSLMDTAHSKAGEIATIIVDNQKAFAQNPDLMGSVGKVLGGIYEIDEDGTKRLKNTIGDKEGGETKRQTLETRVSTNDEGHTTLLLSLSEEYNDEKGSASIVIPISHNLEVEDCNQAKIIKQSGSLGADSFNELGQKMVDAANQAALKFQIYARELDQKMAREGLFKKPQKIISS